MRSVVSFSISTLVLAFLVASVSGQGPVTLTVTTDKQVYDRGTVLAITGQVQDSGSPVPNVVVVFELRDSQNNVKASGFATTDQAGAFSRTITVGNDFAVGSFTVYVSVTVGDQTASNSVSFQVVPEFPLGPGLVMLVAFAVALSFLKKTGRAVSSFVRPPGRTEFMQATSD